MSYVLVRGPAHHHRRRHHRRRHRHHRRRRHGVRAWHAPCLDDQLSYSISTPTQIIIITPLSRAPLPSPPPPFAMQVVQQLCEDAILAPDRPDGSHSGPLATGSNNSPHQTGQGVFFGGGRGPGDRGRPGGGAGVRGCPRCHRRQRGGVLQAEAEVRHAVRVGRRVASFLCYQLRGAAVP